MTWATGGAHSDTAASATSMTWLFAEGATHSGFQAFYLLQNPASTPTDVEVTYLFADGRQFVDTYAVAPFSRRTVWLNRIPELRDAEVAAVLRSSPAPIAAARAMYDDFAGEPHVAGATAGGTPTASADWFFAEGATTTFFDMFLLLGNAESSAGRRRGDIPAWHRRDGDATGDSGAGNSLHHPGQRRRPTARRLVGGRRARAQPQRRSDRGRAGHVVARADALTRWCPRGTCLDRRAPACTGMGVLGWSRRCHHANLSVARQLRDRARSRCR